MIKGLISILIAATVGVTGCVFVPAESPVVDQPPTAYIDSISPKNVSSGETISFSGHGTDADGTVVAYRWRSDIDGDLSTSTQFETTGLSSGTHAVYFQVQDNNGSWSTEVHAEITVTKVTGVLPVINQFSAANTDIAAGSSTRLDWVVSGAMQISIAPDIGSVNDTGSATILPVNTTTFTLTATNAAGMVTANVTVTVSVSGLPSGTEKTVVLQTLLDEDGALVKQETTYHQLETVCVGDTGFDQPGRAFLSFDISSLPTNAIVVEAILDLDGFTQNGDPFNSTSSYGGLGRLEIYYYQYGTFDNLDRIAYNRIAKPTAGGNYVDYPTETWLVDVRESDNGDLVIQNLVNAGASRCQFRLQFFTNTNWDHIADQLCFDNATLTITYTVPD